VRVVVQQDFGRPAQDLAARAAKADLLVVGSHRSAPLTRLFLGSVSSAVLERATCPVAVVPVGPR
jgi:nucleotide-binding universal stress UspA family protein